VTRILIIDADAQARIAAALARAREKPIPWEELSAHLVPDHQHKVVIELADRRSVPRRDPEQVLLAHGYRAAITFEQQPAGLVKHLSVSVDTPGRVPNPPAMQMILQAFEFNTDQLGHFWLEEFAPGHHAVNVAELVPPN
jgi:hypothetical protein